MRLNELLHSRIRQHAILLRFINQRIILNGQCSCSHTNKHPHTCCEALPFDSLPRPNEPEVGTISPNKIGADPALARYICIPQQYPRSEPVDIGVANRYRAALSYYYVIELFPQAEEPTVVRLCIQSTKP